MTPAPASNAAARSSVARLPRAFRLKSRTLIRPLFESGDPEVRSVAAGTIRAVFRFVPQSASGAAPIQVGFFVGRRTGKAVTRNRIRRRMREAYRRRHAEVTAAFDYPGRMLTLALIYRGDSGARWPTIVHDMDGVLDRLLEALPNATRKPKTAPD